VQVRDQVSSAPNGAAALIGSLLAGGVDTCFANPGTSEMHFVAALDAVKGMRPVLGLFEGVVTGAADGYARMAGRPAVALLHLGPGLGNGVANLHNARRAHTPVVVVVGDHATYHKRLDAPLESDIDAIAGAVSGWVRRSWRPGYVGADAADAVAAALGPPGQVATLILPADVSWSAGGVAVDPPPRRPPAPVSDQAVDAAAAALRSGEPVALLVGGPVAANDEALRAAGAIAASTGALLVSETFPARLRRGAGRPQPTRLAYLAEAAVAQLKGRRHLLLAGAASPVSFFAYPGIAGDLVPADCVVHDLGGAGDDAVGALLAVADAVGAKGGAVADASVPALPSGPLTAEAVAATVGALLPEDAIVVDEAVSSAWWFGPALAGSPPHDLITLTGGAIGFGLPAATGAACACPGRPVVCLEADGSAMYTFSALWTQAREGLDVTTVILDNRAYAILRMELARVEAGEPGPVASGLLDLSPPDIDFVALAGGLGVPASRATTAEELAGQLRRAWAEPGPHLIDALIT
jgi:acetolactate synthase-1/2/3 large subunit